MMSQNEQILALLKRGPITALDAVQYGCLRLAARIHDLRMQGHVITTEPVTVNGKQYARYYLMADQSENLSQTAS